MITRKPRSEVLAGQKADSMMADQFDHGDGKYEKRRAAIVSNLVALSAAPAPANKPKKPKPKQTKTPSQKAAEKAAAEAKKKSKKNKVKPKKKSPAAKKPGQKDPNKPKPKKQNHGGGTGGSGSSKKGSGPKKEHIKNRWPKMTTAAKSSYLQSKAGKTVLTGAADEAVSPIWSQMSPAMQRAHLKRHPESRMKVKEGSADSKSKGKMLSNKKKLTPEEQEIADTKKKHQQELEDAEDTGTGPGPQDHRPTEWWAEQTPEFQQDYLTKYPDSKFAKKHKGIVRNLVEKAGSKIKAGVKSLGADYHHGMNGLKNFRQGDKMTDDQKEGLKKTATKVGGLLVLALIGVAIFTPLGPVAMEFGEAWFKQYSMKSQSGVNLVGHEAADANSAGQRKSDAEQLDFMKTDMMEYLMAQKDIPAFVAKLTPKSGS